MSFNNRGFSLIELMVVVVIIGILASIAVPAINKYMARSRQTEVMTNLGALYTTNKAFHSEYGTYATWFGVIGFAPEGRLRYRIGFDLNFPADGAALGGFGYAAGLPAAPGNTNNTGDYCAAIPANCSLDIIAPAVPAAADCTAASFLALGTGFIGGVISDEWTIDQTKDLNHTQDGTF